MNAVTIRPAAMLRGTVRPPGSKSITNRALLIAALASGESRLTGALKSEDTARMAEALRAMGIRIEEPDATTFVVQGNGGTLKVPDGPLFLGNAGTAMRFLTAAAALVDGKVVLDGDAHMQKRPIAPLVQALKALGVDIDAPTGCPPVTIRGTGSVQGGRVQVDAALSSQYVSALLMLGAMTQRGLEVALAGEDLDARGYVTLTLEVMRALGGEAAEISPGVWRVSPTGYHAHDMAIEPDASAATYHWAASFLLGGVAFGDPSINFSQPDAAAWEVMATFPAMPSLIDGSQMQDAVPTLAVMAAFNNAPVRFTGIANLRVKECDRIRALALGLNALREGLAREEGDDLIVEGGLGPHTARPARIDTFADHRIAMSFALAGLVVPGVTILDPGCVAKTYPGFWDDLASLGVGLIFA